MSLMNYNCKSFSIWQVCCCFPLPHLCLCLSQKKDYDTDGLVLWFFHWKENFFTTCFSLIPTLPWWWNFDVMTVVKIWRIMFPFSALCWPSCSVPLGDFGLERFWLQLVVPDPTLFSEHHHVPQVKRLQVGEARLGCCLGKWHFALH